MTDGLALGLGSVEHLTDVVHRRSVGHTAPCRCGGLEEVLGLVSEVHADSHTFLVRMGYSHQSCREAFEEHDLFADIHALDASCRELEQLCGDLRLLAAHALEDLKLLEVLLTELVLDAELRDLAHRLAKCVA